MWYHLTPVRMSIIEKNTNNKCWQVCEEKGGLLHCWWECKLVQPQWKTVWRFLKKLKKELPYDPGIPLLGVYCKKPKTLIQKDTCTPMLTAALLIIGKIWKQPNLNKWMDKKDVVYIYNGILLSHKKEWNLSFAATWMDLEGIMLSEISQKEKDKYCMISLICGI